MSKTTAQFAPTLNLEGIGVGSFVKRRSHDMRGRVIEVHFHCPESAEWVLEQQPWIRVDALRVGYVWFTMLVDGGGSVVVPAYDVERCGAFFLRNAWSAEYFPMECEAKDHAWQKNSEHDRAGFHCRLCNMLGEWSDKDQRVLVKRGSDLPADDAAPFVESLVEAAVTLARWTQAVKE